MIVGPYFKVEICLRFIYILRELSLKYHSEYIPINGIPSLDSCSGIKIFLDPSMILLATLDIYPERPNTLRALKVVAKATSSGVLFK